MIILKQRIILYIGVILCFFYAVSVVSSVSAADIKTQVETVSTTPTWHALLHYRPALLGGVKSTIDSDNFFLASDGKTNPIAELKATIALFDTDVNDKEKQCLFPARYHYLKERGLIQSTFPDCAEYQQFKKDLNPAGITLLYTDAYMNNPSSLFGHTLMRVDIPEGRTQLVAHGINYGAYADERTAGALYAIYGLTGGYYGGFTVKPYYQIINTYNNLENRDIWEYTLNLTPDELNFLVDHIWEVGHTQTRYFFFTENCSYLLMEVLDAVRPSLKLADDFPAQTIPLDTLKAVNARSDLIAKTHYRPSRQRRIAYRYQQMTPVEKAALIAYLEKSDTEKINSLSESEQIHVWDAAYEYVQYQWIKQDVTLKEYRKKSFQILKSRRNIATPSVEPTILGENPVLAHDSMRVSLGVGSQRGHIFEEIGLRGAYHSLTENPQGLLSGAEINFMDIVLRYNPRQQNVRLQQLDIVKISSFSPYNALFHPISYQIDTGIKRQWNPKTNKEKLVYTLRGGSGITFEPIQKLYLYGLFNTSVQYGGGHFPHRYGLSLGVSGGFIYYLPKTQLQMEVARDISDNWMMNAFQAKALINYSVARNWSLELNYEFENRKYHSDNTVKMAIKRYF